jgi:hypothetical protein
MLSSYPTHHARHAGDASTILVERNRPNESQLADVNLEILKHCACLASSAPAETVLASSRRHRLPSIPSEIALLRRRRSHWQNGRAILRSLRNAARDPWMLLQRVDVVIARPVHIYTRAIP